MRVSWRRSRNLEAMRRLFSTARKSRLRRQNTRVNDTLSELARRLRLRSVQSFTCFEILSVKQNLIVQFHLQDEAYEGEIFKDHRSVQYLLFLI